MIESYAFLREIWHEWTAARATDTAIDPFVLLRRILGGHAVHARLADLRHALAPRAGSLDLGEQAFIDRVTPLVAGRTLRLQLAFTWLARNHDEIPLDALRDVLQHLFHDGDILDAMLADLDADGDRAVRLEDFLNFHPDEAPSTPVSAPVPEQTPTASASAPQIATRKHLPAEAISPLQMQTGFFRLLQGAAYRTFRESYSANSESHLRARDLPYTVSDFTRFVRTTVDYYLSLGLVQGSKAQAEFHRLVAMVDAEHAALCDRVAHWDRIVKTPQMLAAESALEQELAELADHRQSFAVAVDYMLRLRAQGVSPTEVNADSLGHHDKDRLRHAEMAHEHGHAATSAATGATPYHDRWSPVILTATGPRMAGTIMPVAFWYDSFMPQLLLCASILSDPELARETTLDAATLDAWHADYTAKGAFDRYGTDLRDGFATCALPVKRALRQAWCLTEHYLNSLQKRREREEFGRETGYLSQYVSFVDLHLSRSDVADAEMRISFPYFIGPAVWCFLHTSANLVEDMDAAARAAATERFKAFFRAFATMYPCPYCRFHLNRYVVRNREVNFYPVEFLLLGQRPDKDWFDISLDDRLATISAERSGSFALFVWKLHNAVSSSISRTESWYHREEHPLYTTRFWPGLDSEIARMRAGSLEYMPVGRLAAIYGVIKPSVELATLRDEIQLALSSGKSATLDPMIASRSIDCISRIETAILDSGLLSQTYVFDRAKTDPPPHLTEADEAYARSGFYVER